MYQCLGSSLIGMSDFLELAVSGTENLVGFES